MMHNITQKTLVDESMGIYSSLSKTFIEYGLPYQICGEPFCDTVEELGKQHNVNASELIDKLDEINRKIHEKS